MLGNHFTMSLKIRVGSLCNWDTKNATKWVPNSWNFPWFVRHRSKKKCQQACKTNSVSLAGHCSSGPHGCLVNRAASHKTVIGTSSTTSH